jgi:hypothetical protein
LTEERQAEQANARDPVKFTIVGAVVVVGLTIGVGVLLMMSAGRKQAAARELEGQWQKLTASPTAGSYRQLKKLSDDLVGIHQKRILLAPQIARIKDLIPPTIHLTQMAFKLSLETSAAGFSPIGGSQGSSKSQPAERLALRLEGGAVGARPRIEVAAFLQAMRTDSVLSNMLQEVTLRSVGDAPVTVNGKAAQEIMAQFVIECLYKEQK